MMADINIVGGGLIFNGSKTCMRESELLGSGSSAVSENAVHNIFCSGSGNYSGEGWGYGFKDGKYGDTGFGKGESDVQYESSDGMGGGSLNLLSDSFGNDLVELNGYPVKTINFNKYIIISDLGNYQIGKEIRLNFTLVDCIIISFKNGQKHFISYKDSVRDAYIEFMNQSKL